MTSRARRQLVARGTWLEKVTLGCTAGEAVASLWAAAVAGSPALAGFGFDSVIEVAASSLVLWRLSDGGREGLRRERIALKGIGASFLLLAAVIAWEAAADLHGRRAPSASFPGVVIGALAFGAMVLLGLEKRRIGRALGSAAMEADAVESLVCAYLSLTLMAGLGLHAAFGWWWADPAAALAMVPFLVWEGWEALEVAPKG